MNASFPLSPKSGRVLQVVRIARISTLNQDERSLDDQLALLGKTVESLYDGPTEYQDLATQGSGEKLDRAELTELEELIESGQVDLVIAEDLARICRRTRAIDFCEICEDNGTRLMAINDRVDTADESWRDGAFISSWHHERSNRDTSSRIKRSLRNRFMNGALLTELGPFYDVPAGATSIDQVRKRSGAEEVVLEVFQMLEDGCSYSEVADWLNDVKQIPPGGSSRKKRWDCVLVRERFLNPRLKGLDFWNAKKTIRINKTGRRKQINADPAETLTRSCPHLAFVDAARFDRLVRLLEMRNAIYRRSPNGAADPLRGRAKKRTPFPGQMLSCGICGRTLVFGGHGRTEHLMCDGARQYVCWNGTTVDGPLAARKIAAAILNLYESLPEFDETFLELVNDEAQQADSERQQRLRQLRRDAHTWQTRIDNLLSFIENGDVSGHVRERMSQAERELAAKSDEILQIESTPSRRIEIPDVTTLKQLARDVLAGNKPFSWEFNKLMRRLTPKIVVFPHRLIDGGHIVHRGWCRIQLGEILSDGRCREALGTPLQRSLCVDLFDPPQREQYREQVLDLRTQGASEREAARTLGITVTAAQAAASLQRVLDA